MSLQVCIMTPDKIFWDEKVEEVLNESGIKYLQGIRYQYQPELNKKELQKCVVDAAKMCL